MQNKIFGHKVENGISFASSDDKAIFLAFGFRAKTSTGGHRFYWFLKGLPELMANENKTTEGKADPETAKFKAGFMTLQNKKGKNRWKAQAEFDEGMGFLLPVLMIRLFSWLSAFGQKHPQAAIGFIGF
ncbi:hypothetical protein BA70_17690 [Bacillus zhangzhouensis]|uniref:Uncharacterized protein n=1 Tax=Bacillus zhangzhouensis TaxID=1178540 RepID=A0A081L692_9BACI|nr:hypothetical protein BA70_17690 [Bacillus zhangzhouensis]